MLQRCKQTGALQPMFMCEVFDMLVRPVGAYGAPHLLIPSMFHKFLYDLLHVDKLWKWCIAIFSGLWPVWVSEVRQCIKD